MKKIVLTQYLKLYQNTFTNTVMQSNKCGRKFIIVTRWVFCLQRSCTLLSRLKFSATLLRHLVPWPSVDTHGKFYGNRHSGNPPLGELNATGVAKYSDFGPIEGYIWEMVKTVLITNRNSYMSVRFVPKSVTLNDLEWCNGPYFEFIDLPLIPPWFAALSHIILATGLTISMHIQKCHRMKRHTIQQRL